MGKIKSKLIRRTAKELINKEPALDEDFNKNKKILKNTISSKKIRNQIAGLISKLKKQEKLKEESMLNTK
jgi:ribosomal protein S17E